MEDFMRNIPIALIGALLILAGCATPTPAERAARAEAEMQRMIQVYGSACERLGYQRDSDQWRSCILQASYQDQFRRQSQRPVSTTCFGHHGFINCTTM